MKIIINSFYDSGKTYTTYAVLTSKKKIIFYIIVLYKRNEILVVKIVFLYF